MPDERDEPAGIPSDEEIQERFRKIRDQLRSVELPDLPEDVSKRLEEPERSFVRPAVPEPPDLNYRRPISQKSRFDDSSYRGLGVGISVAYSLVGFLGVGGLIGWGIDKATHGSSGLPVGLLLGTLVGLGAIVIIITRGNRDS